MEWWVCLSATVVSKLRTWHTAFLRMSTGSVRCTTTSVMWYNTILVNALVPASTCINLSTCDIIHYNASEMPVAITSFC